MTNVRWLYDDQSLVSVGGADCSLLVWRLISRSRNNSNRPISSQESRLSLKSGRAVNFDDDSGSNDNDDVNKAINNANKRITSSAIQSDDSDDDDDDEDDDEGVGGYDSDVDKELKIDYVSKFNVNPLRYKKDNKNNNNNDDENNANNNSESYNINKNNDNKNNASGNSFLMNQIGGGIRDREKGPKEVEFNVNDNYFVERLELIFQIL